MVVAATQDAPAPWSGALRVEIDDRTLIGPAEVVRRLHRAWAAREPMVISLSVDPAAFRDPQSLRAEPWTLEPGFELWQDRLQFVVWANSYDARRADQPPVWWWGRKAARLGASLPPDAAGPGDVVVAGAGAVWIDGGPRTAWPAGALGGVGVVHRESVERGRLSVASPVAPPVAALAADQLAAVAHGSGPARIIAPAGSGKTRVLTERLRHLVVDRGWERDAVLAVAYNKKAQEELDERCRDFGPRTRTLNALGLALLRQASAAPPKVLDEREARQVVETLMPSRRWRANTDPVSPYLEGLSLIRMGLVDPEAVEASRDDVPGLARMFPAYRAALADQRAVDFDEQIYAAIELLLADGAMRLAAQIEHRHLLVDEFQDLTPAHVLLVRLLAAPALDVFGVGDDDQVIYGHAGADPAFLIAFDELFPAAASHPLEVNYRCPPGVVEVAATLLSYNDRRVAKVIRSGRAEGGEDAVAPVLLRHPPAAGADALVDQVGAWRDAGVPADGIAVLSRVNSLLLAPHVALVSAGVPVSSTLRPDVLERTGLRAALAYLRIATAADGAIAARDLVEVLRRPSRGLPPWFADRLRRRSTWGLPALSAIGASLADRDAGKVEQFVADVAAVRSAAGASAGTPGGVAAGPVATTQSLLRAVREEIGLGGAMTLLDRSRGGEGASHLDDLDALEQVAALHPDPTTFESWLRAGFARQSDPGGVVLSTVHRVKGMEWDAVAVVAVNAGVLPHRLAADEEEERRVLHVAVTRARQALTVLADQSRPSPFLGELEGTATHERRSPPAGRSSGGAGSGGAASGRAGGRGSDALGGGRRQPVSPSGPLEDALRAWRRERCRRDKVSAFIVSSDRTLRAVAAARPITLVALRQVEGIGPTKLELYGEEILAVVAAFGGDDESGGDEESGAVDGAADR